MCLVYSLKDAFGDALWMAGAAVTVRLALGLLGNLGKAWDGWCGCMLALWDSVFMGVES